MKKAMLAVVMLVVVWAAGCCPMRRMGLCLEPRPHMGRVRHVVLLKFKDGAAPEQVAAIEQAFRALPAKVEAIRDFEWGTDMSAEGLTAGYTHCFLVTFASAKERDAYLPHPAHKAFGKQLGPILDKVLVIDYVARE